MARDTSDLTPIASVEDMVAHIRAGEKPRHAFRIGTEHEKFPYYAADLSPVPYEGANGIRALLEGMRRLSGWEAILDDGRIIGLFGAEGQGAISLEPGGQFELSGAPLETIHDTCRESNRHLADVRSVARDLGIAFLGLGASPLWNRDETPRMPKSRYDIMARYMPKVGTRGLDMMFRTSTIQVNLDFESEADMARKMRIGQCLQPVASALFANSPFADGAASGLDSWRCGVWLDVDNRRSGLLPAAFEPGYTYRQYVEWALDAPMYFVTREGRYHDATSVTFRQFADGALEGVVPDARPNLGDWTNHLSTLFPDVRLKRFLEMRGADGGPWRRICALPAFWVGLLYDETALGEADALTEGWRFAEVDALRSAVPEAGLDAPFRGGTALGLARAALEIARGGLARRARLDGEGHDETHFLGSLEEVAARGTSSARELARLFETQWNRSMERVFTQSTY